MKALQSLFLAVNPDGTEVATNNYPFRAWDQMIYRSTPEYRKSHPLEKYCEDKWVDCICQTDYGYYGEDYDFEGIILPPGTIKSLTGKTLTWESEPIEIEFV